jgi:hypothetical protein
MHGDDLPTHHSQVFDEADGAGRIVQADVIENAIEIAGEVPTVKKFPEARSQSLIRK